MATEVLGPFYVVSTGSKGRGLSVSSPEWLWAPLERWEELTGFLASGIPWENWFQPVSWRRWAVLELSRGFLARGKLRIVCSVVLVA